MSIYVDDKKIICGDVYMSRLIADTPQELKHMAKQLTVPTSLIYRDYLQISRSQKEKAIDIGAIPIIETLANNMLEAYRNKQSPKTEHRLGSTSPHCLIAN